MVSDLQLCADLATALKEALLSVGYLVAETPDDPHAATVRVYARQAFAGGFRDNDSATVTVQVVVEAEGQEVDRTAQNGDVNEGGGEKALVRTFARAMVLELAHSRRMRTAHLTPGS
jgi:hypothetical protein